MAYFGAPPMPEPYLTLVLGITHQQLICVEGNQLNSYGDSLHQTLRRVPTIGC